MKNSKGKTELSQFMALKEFHILDTEATIKYLYSRYGPSVFQKYTK